MKKKVQNFLKDSDLRRSLFKIFELRSLSKSSKVEQVTCLFFQTRLTTFKKFKERLVILRKKKKKRAKDFFVR